MYNIFNNTYDNYTKNIQEMLFIQLNSIQVMLPKSAG